MFLFSHICLTHLEFYGRPLLPFAISHRNSATAIAHLVGGKDVKYIWVTEGPMRALINEAKLIKGSTPHAHRYPKSLSAWFNFMMKIEQSNVGIKGDIMAVHTSPLFHAMGVFATVWPAVSGYIRAASSPQVSPSPMTPESFLQQIVESQAMLLFCVPSFLEFWGRVPLWSEAGVLLCQEGVYIRSLYGATEFDAASLISAEPYTKGYEWFEFLPSISLELVPNSEEEDVYELVIKESETHSLAIHNAEIKGVPAYATNDLIERHKTNPKLFKIRGRKDDQIMLSTGEKNPHVKKTVMFGRGRLSNGILIEPTSYEEAENIGLENFRNLIWSSIEAANDYAPAHSRIFKETILVASALKPFSYMPKRNVGRGAIINDYALEIEAMYQAIQDSSQTDIPIPPGSSEDRGWTLEESLQFVHEAMDRVMTDVDDMGDDDDIFGYGSNSLQAMYIQNSILHTLQQVAPAANVLKPPSNFVYQHPTIRALAEFSAKISQTTALSDVNPEVERRERLRDYVARYTQNWPVHSPSESDPTTERILLTGSTGGLGSQLLAQLVAMPSMSRIYAFNRPGQKTSHKRQLNAFLDRGNDIALNSEKNNIRGSDNYHTQWYVVYISLVSFEPIIWGVRNMIDLALKSLHASPPHVMFTSSIGNVKSWADIPPVAKSPVIDLSLINTSGYSESKWVSERILRTAGQSTPLHPVIVHVGQLSGGVNGNWNMREWFPALA
ncbi:hypothetical protein K439DRAFT_1561338 [Ramaria rubella]|nr:hypothetical protein K439DRAFT_1561338 [Ramaria rubella]